MPGRRRERRAALAIMDSIAITALRTAAASAVAAKYLVRDESATALIVGCGGQARAQLIALHGSAPSATGPRL